MDDLLDIFKVFKFLRRLANFKSMSLWQKILTVVGGLGLLLTGVLAAVSFFLYPTLEVEDFNLTPAHQVSYNACQKVGEDYQMEYLGDVTTAEACSCYSRHWAHEYDAGHQSDFGLAMVSMISYYSEVEITEDESFDDVKRKFSREYAKRAGTLTEVPRTTDVMYQQMATLMDASATCLDFLSYDKAGIAAMLALRPFADALIDVPQSEADVVIALRGSSNILTLTASN